MNILQLAVNDQITIISKEKEEKDTYYSLDCIFPNISLIQRWKGKWRSPEIDIRPQDKKSLLKKDFDDILEL